MGVVVGFDPGLANLGWAVADLNDDGTARHIAHGVCMSRPTGQKTNLDFAMRQATVVEQVDLLIQDYKPQQAVLEAFVYFGKSTSSSIAVSNVIGGLRQLFRFYGIPLAEYTTQQIKWALTHSMHASKAMVEAAVRQKLGLKKHIRPVHAADALAAALAHAILAKR